MGALRHSAELNDDPKGWTGPRWRENSSGWTGPSSLHHYVTPPIRMMYETRYEDQHPHRPWALLWTIVAILGTLIFCV